MLLLLVSLRFGKADASSAVPPRCAATTPWSSLTERRTRRLYRRYSALEADLEPSPDFAALYESDAPLFAAFQKAEALLESWREAQGQKAYAAGARAAA